jgi:hypothetical protein
MAEWLILLLLVPAIVVPVVLLVGFAGCNQVFEIRDTTNQPPVIDEAVGVSGTIIHLIWHFDGSERNFELQRTNPDGTTISFENLSALLFDDIGLTPDTTYSYQVRNLSPSNTQNWSNPVTANTLPFANTFSQPLTGPGTNDGKEWQGFTLVQRIESARLSTSGTQRVILTLVAGSDVPATIDAIYISQPDPTAAMSDPRTYQPAADLTAVSTSRFQVPPSGHDVEHPVILTLAPVNYALDHAQALLIAVDFTAPPAATESWVRFADVTNPGEVIAYYFQGAEASRRPRSANYTPVDNRIYFITNIDVK